MRNFAAANKRRTDMNEFISRLHKSFRHHPVLFNILLAFEKHRMVSETLVES